MIHIRKLALPFGGVVLVAGALTLAVPKAAHAVAAALVEITNTAASPVIAQGIGQQAAQIVQIECGNTVWGQYPGGCIAVLPTTVSAPSTNYTVPSGQTLVITSVDILSGAASSPCTSSAEPFMEAYFPDLGKYATRKQWIVPGGTGTAHYVYPSGFLFASGSEPNFGNGGTCTITLDLSGYLTAQ